MYITHNNIEFEIYLNKKDSIIHIKGKRSNNVYILSAPIDLRNNELIQYLNVHAQGLIKNYEKSILNHESCSIKLYDKSFLYQYKPNIEISYLYKGVIYSSISTKSALNVKNICKEILSYDIRGLIGLWEERLEIILENIYFSNYKTKPFYICSHNKSITFSTQLMNKQFDYLEFIVAKSVFIFLKFEDSKQEILMNEFVSNYKLNNKIFEYEKRK